MSALHHAPRSAALQAAIGLLGLLSHASAVSAERVAPLDLTQHDPADKADLKLVGEGLFEWSLPTGDARALHLDLAKLGINPAEFDELRFDIQPKWRKAQIRRPRFVRRIVSVDFDLLEEKRYQEPFLIIECLNSQDLRP